MDKLSFVTEPKTLEWARTPDICNTTNHRDETFNQEEYNRIVKLFDKNNWVRLFPDPPGTIVHTFSVSESSIIRAASKISIITLKRPGIYGEELADIDRVIQTKIDNNQSYFIRSEHCSPKDSRLGGYGPFRRASQIVNSIITSDRMISSCDPSEPIRLYIVPWRSDWDLKLEFRTFMYQGKLTAISQYHWFENVGLTEEKMLELAGLINDFYRENIDNFLRINHSAVVDLVYNVVTQRFDLVEFNSFGREMSSGSALFHWLNDYDKLYGLNEYCDVCSVRYISG
jgi:hypothetical protein